MDRAVPPSPGLRWSLIRAFLCAFVALALTPTSRGGVIITFSQNGADVDATATGSLNLTALTFAGSPLGGPGASVAPNGALVVFGTNFGFNESDDYTGITGPGSFGPGQGPEGAVTTGPDLGIDGGGFFFGGPPPSNQASWDARPFRRGRKPQRLAQ
jgi:hypothetical protein